MSWVCTNCTLSVFFLHTFADTSFSWRVLSACCLSQVTSWHLLYLLQATSRNETRWPRSDRKFFQQGPTLWGCPSHCWTVHAVPPWHCEQIHQSKLPGRNLSSVFLCCEFAAPLGCPEAGAAGTDGNVGVSVGWRCHNNKQLDAVYWVDLCAAKWISGCLMGTKWIEG